MLKLISNCDSFGKCHIWISFQTRSHRNKMLLQGFKNDMKIAMDQVDQDYLNEILKSGGSDPDQQSRSTDVKVKDTTLTIEEILVWRTLVSCVVSPPPCSYRMWRGELTCIALFVGHSIYLRQVWKLLFYLYNIIIYLITEKGRRSWQGRWSLGLGCHS